METNYSFKKLFFAAVLIASITAISYSQNSVSGTVRFIDNNEPVDAGYVLAFNAVTFELIASTTIQSNGTYILNDLQSIETDIIGIRNDEWGEDFISTYFPNEQEWENAVSIIPVGQMTGIDIYVERWTNPGGKPTTGYTIAGSVFSGTLPLQHAIVQIKDFNGILKDAVTNSDGIYKLNDIPEGDYILVIQRIGHNTVIKNITVTSTGIKDLNFNLTKYVKSSGDNVSSSVKLTQNYPNPFNPVTKFSYTLPKSSNVSVIVYDVMGRVVSELVNNYQTAGNYEVEFNGTKLSSGVYYYRIITDSYNDTKRMILVK
jgi:hypothetical protein